MTNEISFHTPAFEKTIIQHLAITSGMVLVDGTFGEGGHASIIVPVLGSKGRYIAIDRDKEILEKGRKRLEAYHDNIDFVHSSYADLDKVLDSLNITSVDRILLDLGLSMYHLKTFSRGFSFMSDAPLDMRFDSSKSPVSAFDVIHHFQESEISDILYTFGEERMSRQIAERIVEKRKVQVINTCSALAKIIAGVKGMKKGAHPATKSFQALRIYVNAELHHLETFLGKAHSFLNPGGLLSLITYHSMEDRIVKRFALNSHHFNLREKKPLPPDQEELSSNPAVRSAKLRVLVRL